VSPAKQRGQVVACEHGCGAGSVTKQRRAKKRMLDWERCIVKFYKRQDALEQQACRSDAFVFQKQLLAHLAGPRSWHGSSAQRRHSIAWPLIVSLNSLSFCCADSGVDASTTEPSGSLHSGTCAHVQASSWTTWPCSLRLGASAAFAHAIHKCAIHMARRSCHVRSWHVKAFAQTCCDKDDVPPLLSEDGSNSRAS
jgi:hypothetical protein